MIDERIELDRAVIVEGKYDKIRLDSVVKATIIETGGFRIYKDKQKQGLIRKLAQKNGIIIVTDSDKAGFQLRSFVKSLVKDADITNLYIPQINGKERRKAQPSKEELLGVEGIEREILRKLFLSLDNKNEKKGEQVTKMDFFEDGLTGGENSAERRKTLIKKLGLPSYITTNSLIDVINILVSYEEYKGLIAELGRE